MNRLYTTLLLAIAFLLVSCGEDRRDEYLEMTAENQWIYSQMKERYLWGEEIGEPERKEFFDTPSKFFKSLLQSHDKASFLADSASVLSYGMRTAVMRDPLGEKRNRYYALALFVEPGSPADLAGIKRGTWIESIDGKALTSSSGNTLASGEGAEITTQAMEYNDEEERYFWGSRDTLTLHHAMPATVEAIYLDSIYSVRNNKIGYIVCNSLSREETAERFNDILTRFAQQQVTDIVLDMRYCNGGEIGNAAKIASMFVPSSLGGTPFATLADKNSNETPVNYTEQAINLSDKKLYIITSRDTKGIAELFIASVNASREMYDVMIAGMPTAGLNVMTEAIESPYGFTINPAVAELYLSNGSALSSSGVEPDYPINELDEVKQFHQIGSEQEYILRSIEYLIVNGSMPN